MIRRTFIDGGDHFFINEDGHLVMSDGRNDERVLVDRKNLQSFTEFLLGEVTATKLQENLNVD